MHTTYHGATSTPGFGISDQHDRFDEKTAKLSSYRIWKKLFQPEHTSKDPYDPYRIVYNHHTPESIKTQMARRMDRKVIKLEAAYGSERQFIVVKRNQDLIVRDLLEEVQRVYKIPIDEQVVFYKGTHLGDFMNETLESLGIENNQSVRVTRDTELPNRSPRMQRSFAGNGNANVGGAIGLNYAQNSGGIDAASYVKDIATQQHPFMVQSVGGGGVGHMQSPRNSYGGVPAGSNPSDVLKLYVSFGSEREYMLIHGKKPLMILDLKLELSRAFKIPPEQQCIVFRGYNLHEYMDDAPLEAFGLENNSPISLWPKGSGNKQDVRLPRGPSPPPNQLMADMFSPRLPNAPPGSQTQRWMNGDAPAEVLKLEVQHGSDRHPLILKGQNKTLTVLDLQNELERMTAVPVRDQRIFFKAQELHTAPFKTLKECELENNSSVKMVGEPSKVRYSNYFGRLNPGAPQTHQQPIDSAGAYQLQQQFGTNYAAQQQQQMKQQMMFGQAQQQQQQQQPQQQYYGGQAQQRPGGAYQSTYQPNF